MEGFHIKIVAIGIVFSICLGSHFSPASAEIYKCVDDKGKITFSSHPGPGCALVPGSVKKARRVDGRPPTPVPQPPPFIDPLELEVGKNYVLSKKTPLMPTHSAKDVFKALKQANAIPKGNAIKIIKRHEKNGHLWYQVLAINHKKQFLATGWVNSSALFGQHLELLP